jgi:hypothetical protein
MRRMQVLPSKGKTNKLKQFHGVRLRGQKYWP